MSHRRPKTSTYSPSKMTVVDVPHESIPEEVLISIYRWLDELRFSRSKKKSTHRDFADGVMMAELVWQHIPKIVDLVNYQPASSSARKRENWQLLNSRVFKRISFQLSPKLLAKVADAVPGMIEQVLCKLRAILILGPLALLPPAERLHQVKSRFTSVQRIFSEQDNSVDTISKRTSPGSSPARSRSRSRPRTAPIPTLGGSSSTTQNHGINMRPSTARASASTPPQIGVIDEFDIIRLYPSKPPSRGDSTVEIKAKDDSYLSESEEETIEEPPMVVDHNGNEEEEYEEIYCDCAPKESKSDGEKQYDSARTVCKQKMKRVVRKYEHREEYVLNGLTVGSTTYSLPSDQQEVKSLTDGRDRSIKSK